MTDRVCLVVPCYNEALRLNVAAFQDYLAQPDAAYLFFVNDGSRDATQSVLESVCEGYTRSASVLRLGVNRGKAEAVRAGLLHCLDEFGPTIIGFWDADLATPLDAVCRFRQVLASRPEIEMVFGARVQLLGRYVQRSAARHYLGRVFATAVSAVLDLPIYDTQCGAKLFRVRPQTRSIFTEPFLSRWVFDVEILARYARLYELEGKSIAQAIYEYPLEFWRDVAGSKVGPADFFIALRDILRIRSKYLK